MASCTRAQVMVCWVPTRGMICPFGQPLSDILSAMKQAYIMIPWMPRNQAAFHPFPAPSPPLSVQPGLPARGGLAGAAAG